MKVKELMEKTYKSAMEQNKKEIEEKGLEGILKEHQKLSDVRYNNLSEDGKTAFDMVKSCGQEIMTAYFEDKTLSKEEAINELNDLEEQINVLKDIEIKGEKSINAMRETGLYNGALMWLDNIKIAIKNDTDYYGNPL